MVKKAPSLIVEVQVLWTFHRYLDPNKGLAYLGGNNCENCGVVIQCPTLLGMESTGKLTSTIGIL